MSSKKPSRFRSSLSFRLTLWYAGIFAVSSFVAFLLFYALITSVIRERTDQELLSQAAQFSALLAGTGHRRGRKLRPAGGPGGRGKKSLYPASLSDG